MFATTVTISQDGQIKIPKSVFDSLHWNDGMELTLMTTESGVMLMPKKEKTLSAKSLRGCLQHTGKPVPTDKLCKPVGVGGRNTLTTELS